MDCSPKEAGRMTAAGVLVFLAAYGTAVAVPGPGVASLIARVLARGLNGAPAYIAGFVAGDLIWFGAAAMGLTAIAAAFQPLITTIRFAGAAYLLYLAVRLFTAGPAGFDDGKSDSAPSPPIENFGAALALTLGNPKIIIFFVALLPAVLDLKSLSFQSAVIIAVLMSFVLSAILGGYALLAHRARQFLRNPRAIRAMNITTGAVMAGAAVAIAAK
jgi:threonine/homoserine/homoserine lactone efflux protein